MARVTLDIADMANRLTLKGLLERSGHQIVDRDAQVFIADTPAEALRRVGVLPVLLLSGVASLSETLLAMEKGVFGYILLPFQPGEANLMVARALQSAPISTPHTEPTTENLRSLQAVEADHILNALRVCKNNQAKAAKILGIGRNTLWRKLKKIEATRRDE